jgi:hypothetical protein
MFNLAKASSSFTVPSLGARIMGMISCIIRNIMAARKMVRVLARPPVHGEFANPLINGSARAPPTAGNIIAFPEVGGLHHRYERRAA